MSCSATSPPSPSQTLLLLLLAIATTGCREAPASTPPATPRVRVAPVRRAPGRRELLLGATIESKSSFLLSFSSPGTVRRVFVDKGDRVNKGQVLASLDPQSYRDSLAMAAAAAKQADDAYRRFLPMFRNRTTAEIRMVDIRTKRKQAHLAVSLARKRLRDTRLRAPVDGVVADRRVEVGASTAPGVPAFTLVQTQRLEGKAAVPEIHIGKVKKGAKVIVDVPALGRSFSSTIRSIAVIANPLTRSFDVRVPLDNSKGELRIGMIARLRLPVETGATRLLVPPEAVRVDADGATYVYVVDDAKLLQRRIVHLDGFEGEGTIIRSGLRAGERVVVSGTPMLGPQRKVEVVSAPKVVRR